MIFSRHSHPASGKILGSLLLVLLVLAIAGTILFQIEKQPETSPVSRGEKLARQAGCFACHGRSEGEPRFNLRQAGDKWAGKTNPTFWDGDITKADELKEWIANGVTAEEAERHKKLFIRMPAYQDRLTADEIDAIAAWILAEGLKFSQAGVLKAPRSPAPPKLTGDALLVAGDRLSRQAGCYQCHGELGQGGVPNPGSFKGYIPGFFGEDLRKLTANGDRTEILHWIDHGRGHAIEQGLTGRLTKRYFEGQATPMPGYRDQLSPAEKELLADFVLLINKAGPLPAREIERLLHLIDSEPDAS